MKLVEIIRQENIIPDLKAKDKKGVLEELSSSISSAIPSVNKDELVKILVEREQLGSTGIGEGVAIPHGRISGIKKPMLAFGKCKKGLDFDSVDGELVYLLFLLIAPENSSGTHLQILAKVAKILKNSGFRNKLMEYDTRDDLFKVIVKTDEED